MIGLHSSARLLGTADGDNRRRLCRDTETRTAHRIAKSASKRTLACAGWIKERQATGFFCLRFHLVSSLCSIFFSILFYLFIYSTISLSCFDSLFTNCLCFEGQRQIDLQAACFMISWPPPLYTVCPPPKERQDLRPAPMSTYFTGNTREIKELRAYLNRYAYAEEGGGACILNVLVVPIRTPSTCARPSPHASLEIQRSDSYVDVVKRVILYMTQGIDVSGLLTEMIMVRPNPQSDDPSIPHTSGKNTGHVHQEPRAEKARVPVPVHVRRYQRRAESAGRQHAAKGTSRHAHLI